MLQRNEHKLGIPALPLTLGKSLHLLEPLFLHLEIKGDNAYHQEAPEGFLEVTHLDPALVPNDEVGATLRSVLPSFLGHFCAPIPS